MKLQHNPLRLLTACSLCACASALSAQTAAPVDSTWHSSHAFRDMTGDGIPDSLSLVARGRHTDSLTIAFTIHVGGQLVHRQFWKSRSHIFSQSPPPPARAWTHELKMNELAQQFATFFSDASFAPLSEEKNTATLSKARFELRISQYLRNGANDALMLMGVNVDSADMLANRLRANPVALVEVREIAELMREANPLTFSYFRGRASVIAWSSRTRSFLTIHGCC